MARAHWWVIGSLVFVLSIVLLLQRGAEYTYVADARLSSFRPTPDGARALYLTLEELGVPVAQRLTPFADADTIAGPLALLAPTEPLTPREVDALRAFLERGGYLIYVARPPYLSMMMGDEVLRLFGGLSVAPLEFFEDEDSAAALRVVPHRWTRGLPPVGGFGVGLAADSAGIAPLVRYGEGVLVGTARVGAGTALLVSDPAPLRNANIDSAGLAVATLIARAAAERTAPGRPLVFAEYHHGARGGSVGDAVVAFLTGQPAGWLLTQVIVVGLVGLVAAGWRFGAPVRLRTRPRRSPLEHADALAQVYREAGARELPQRLLLAGLARRLGRPRPRSEADVAALLERVRSAMPAAAGDVAALERALDDRHGLAAAAAAIDSILERLNG